MAYTNRRSFLLGTGGLLTVPLTEVSSIVTDPGQRTQVSSESPLLTMDYSSNIHDAYIVASHGIPIFGPDNEFKTPGWETFTYKQIQRTLLRLHPDILGYQRTTGFFGPPAESGLPPDARNAGLFAREQQLPSTIGGAMHFNVESLSDWYDSLSESNRWRYPDGSLVDSPREATFTRVSGDKQVVHDPPFYAPTIYNPGLLELKSTIAIQALELGFSSFYIDSPTSVAGPVVDVSEWAIDAFQTHLESLDASRLSELGIESPASFDFRTYLESENLQPGEVSTPIEDPVVREYVLFHHRNVKSYYESLRGRIEEAYPNRTDENAIKFYGNQFVGTNFRNSVAASTYLSDPFHVVTIEDNPTVPPDRIRDVVYKYGIAAGRFEKPVFVEGKMQSIADSTYGLDPTQKYPTLMSIQIAEGYAMGAVRELSLTGWGDVPNDEVVNNLVQSDGTIPPEVQTLIDFIKANQRLLDEPVPANDVAVVLSLPTLLWRVLPQWQDWEEQAQTHVDSFLGAAELLRREQIPYDVIILGHEELWTDDEQLERLSSYETVVFPSIECISSQQTAAVQSAIGESTSLVVSGDTPDKTEMFDPQDEFTDSVMGSGAVTQLPEDPARKWKQTESDGDSFIDAIDGSTTRQIELSEDGNIGVNVLQDPDEQFTCIHLMNYEYNSDQDAVQEQSNIDLTVRRIQSGHEVLKWYTPNGVTPLEASSSGSEAEFTVTIPSVKTWGFLVATDTESTITSAVSESEATSKIEQARSAIEDAQSAERTVDLTRAEIALEGAESLQEHRGYAQSAELAEAAFDEATTAYERPRVGIDQVHGQPESRLGYGQFSDLRTRFDQYEYVSLDEWTEESLSELDVLIVPPALEFEGASAGYTQADLETVQQFVENGGSLLILARGGIAPGVNTLAKQFGFRFDGSTLASTTNVDVRSITTASSLNRMIPFQMVHVGTTLTKVESGTVLSRIPEESQAYFDTENSDANRDAAGSPMMAAAQFGDGIVAAYGQVYDFQKPILRVNRRDVVRNILNVFTAHASNVDSAMDSMTTTPEETTQPTTQTPTTTSTPSNRASTPMAESTSTTGPGFGVGAAVGAFVGAGALLRLLRRDSES